MGPNQVHKIAWMRFCTARSAARRVPARDGGHEILPRYYPYNYSINLVDLLYLSDTVLGDSW